MVVAARVPSRYAAVLHHLDMDPNLLFTDDFPVSLRLSTGSTDGLLFNSGDLQGGEVIPTILPTGSTIGRDRNRQTGQAGRCVRPIGRLLSRAVL